MNEINLKIKMKNISSGELSSVAAHSILDAKTIIREAVANGLDVLGIIGDDEDALKDVRRYASKLKYEKKVGMKRFLLNLNRQTESDIIDWIENLENKQGTLKSLIRAEIERTKK